MNLVRIFKRFPIDKNLFLLPFDNITRQADNPLYKILAGVFRIFENNDITLAGITNLKNLGISERNFCAVEELGDQQVVTYQ